MIPQFGERNNRLRRLPFPTRFKAGVPREGNCYGLGAPAGLGLRELVTWLLRQGMLEAAERLDSLARRPCGADLNPLIIEAGFDGEEHHICCPQCQLEISYHAPWWPDLEEG
ncbi:MAG TPA: hypothetical protein VNP04_21490 [Alphaproteobacteria bacterium]|nr:hypothetical protein [Alphaproteobacteria bacterium]